MSLAAGAAHACAVSAAGQVKCWGSNASGQLGDGTTTERTNAVAVSGLASGTTNVAAGDAHSCALTNAGAVKCWGNNDYGQLGDGTTLARLAPVAVAGLASGVVAIAAGGAHSCAVLAGGGVRCWGRNDAGQVGDNTTTARLTPVDVSGLASGVAAIAAGGAHTCARTAAGAVKCWGGNEYGAVGDATTTTRLAPVAVAGLAAGVTAIAAGYRHTCAVAGGALVCWGYNYAGQVGDGGTDPQPAPVAVTGLGSGVASVAAGYLHTCALTTGGGVRCWGGNESGTLGDGTTTGRLSPVNVNQLAAGATALAAGSFHQCAIVGGGVSCWGRNDAGQLGDGESDGRRLTAVPVGAIAGGATALAGGDVHTCALTGAGGAKCWGANFGGVVLGDGSQTAHLAPVDVAGLASGVSALRAGAHHSCALAGGAVKCWGANANGELGDGSTTDRPTAVTVAGLVGGAVALAVGDAHSCAVQGGGGLRCWGYNGEGQLGIGNTVGQAAPVDVSGLASGVAAAVAGYRHTCALTAAGAVKCWGGNDFGQVGDGSNAQRLAPVDVAGLGSGVLALAAGGAHTCALSGSGGVKCWGNNDGGQLGDGSTTARSAPVDVAGLTSGVTAIAAGDAHTCALTAAGVQCWGNNAAGQLGDGTTAQRPLAAAVTGLAGATAIAAGRGHACALTGGGAVCWGDNREGQTGDGTAAYRTVPASIVWSLDAPQVVSVVSRKLHAGAGTFDLPLAAAPADPTVEPRAGVNGDHTIVFTFDAPVTGGNAVVTSGAATAGVPTWSGNELRVPLLGASNAQYVTLLVTDVASAGGGTGGSASVRFGLLAGDVDGSRAVTLSDLLAVNAVLAQPVSASTYLRDVELSGSLTLTDKLLVNANLTQALPAP